MAAEETYNGWKNYPTWCVNLWLSNDEGLVEATLERTREVIAEEKSHHVRSVVADELKTWVREDLTPDLSPSFPADLLGYALDCVDWYEIADAWIEIANEDA